MRLYTKQFRFAPLVAVVEHPSTVRDMHGSCGAGGVGDSLDWHRVAVEFHAHIVEAVQRSAFIHAWHFGAHAFVAVAHAHCSFCVHWDIVVAAQFGRFAHSTVGVPATGEWETFWQRLGQVAAPKVAHLRMHDSPCIMQSASWQA